MKFKILAVVLALMLVFTASACSLQVATDSERPTSETSESTRTQTSSASNGGTSENSNATSQKSANSQSSTQSSKVSSSQSKTNSNVASSTTSGSRTSSTSSGTGTVGDTIERSNPVVPQNYQYTLKNANFTGTSVNSSISAFNVEGYASGVTGGGTLQEGDEGYVKVSTAKEFMTAISRKNYSVKNDTGFATRPMVVELVNDISLGWNEIGADVQAFSDIVSANAPTVHPVLKQTGVSTVYINGRENLTIFSKNGSAIKHACFQIRGSDGTNGQNPNSKNIIIRNIRFEGAWEWDDSGKYDNNDWDTFTIRADKGSVSKIWIDHCTFTKPYDGTIDIKYHATDITISWCSFIPYGKEDAEFMEMMNYLENNRSSFPNYNSARNGGASFDDMINYASINKKVHLLGHTDNHAGDEVFRITYCNNYYNNCTERLPRLRMGKAHVYNCIFDASQSNILHNKVKSNSISWPSALAFASNGSLGTNKGQLLMENCYINGITTPLRNNNKKAGADYVGACDALYTYYTIDTINRSCDYGENPNVQFSGRYTFLGHSTKAESNNLMQPFPCAPLAFNTDAFKSALSYEYTLYEPEKLYLAQDNNVGAGQMNFSVNQWEKAVYSNETVSNKIPSGGVVGSTANLGASRA